MRRAPLCLPDAWYYGDADVHLEPRVHGAMVRVFMGGI